MSGRNLWFFSGLLILQRYEGSTNEAVVAKIPVG
jgi:hypothetical protein